MDEAIFTINELNEQDSSLILLCSEFHGSVRISDQGHQSQHTNILAVELLHTSTYSLTMTACTLTATKHVVALVQM